EILHGWPGAGPSELASSRPPAPISILKLTYDLCWFNPKFHTFNNKICTINKAKSCKVKTICDGILFRSAVVALASAGLDESPFLVQRPGRVIRLAHLSKHHFRAPNSRLIKKLAQQTCSQAVSPG